MGRTTRFHAWCGLGLAFPIGYPIPSGFNTLLSERPTFHRVAYVDRGRKTHGGSKVSLLRSVGGRRFGCHRDNSFEFLEVMGQEAAGGISILATASSDAIPRLSLYPSNDVADRLEARVALEWQSDYFIDLRDEADTRRAVQKLKKILDTKT